MGKIKANRKKKKTFSSGNKKLQKKKSLVKGKGKISRINMKMKVGQQTQ